MSTARRRAKPTPDPIPGIAPEHHPQALLDNLLDWMDAHGEDDDEREPDPPEPEATGLRTVSAWAGSGSLADPKGYASFAKALGLQRVDLMVNEHSAWRDPTPFDTYAKGKIVAFAEQLAAAGIELHLTSWLMPHVAYIEDATSELAALRDATGAVSIMFDCEEPWTQARKRLNYGEAAKMVRDRLPKVPIGVTGIGYAPPDKLGPICSIADYLVPQCYSTSTSKQDPKSVASRFVGRWRHEWPGMHVEVGLAAYRQDDIEGHTIESAMRAAFADARAQARSSVAIYWSLAAIRKSKAVARVVAELVAGLGA